MSEIHYKNKINTPGLNGAQISTCMTLDTDHLYETAVSCLKYKEGDWIIVEEYDTREQAQAGHDKWLREFEKGLPDELKDVSTCVIHKMILALSGK